MRGDDQKQAVMFSYVALGQRIPVEHPLREIRVLVDRALARMDTKFEQLYSSTGRPLIAPERLLRATLLMVLYCPGVELSGRWERFLEDRVLCVPPHLLGRSERRGWNYG